MQIPILETIRTYNQKPFRLEDHLVRLFLSAKSLGFGSSWNAELAKQEVEKALDDFLKENAGESKIRIILSDEKLMVTAEPLEEKPAEMYEHGVKLVSYLGVRELPQVKRLEDALCHTAKEHALSRGAYESILVDADGYVRECAYANLFWVRNGVLYTTNEGILFGITRQTVLELAEEIEKGYQFEDIKLPSLLGADEVFITQTTSGILPVAEINGHRIGSGRPGPMTKKLLMGFVWH